MIGDISIPKMIAAMAVNEVKLFPIDTFTSMESVRTRVSFANKRKQGHYITSKEPEGIYVIRLR